MPRGGRKDSRETFTNDSIRFRVKTDLDKIPAPPPKNCEVYVLNDKLVKKCSNGRVVPIGAEIVFGEASDDILCCGILDPVQTTNAIPVVAYSEELLNDHVYFYTARFAIRQQTAGNGSGNIMISVCVRREDGGSAEIIGDVFQEMKRVTNLDWDANWEVLGNHIRLTVTGADGMTVEWQPTLKREVVS